MSVVVAGSRALVVGDSGGIGAALAQALRARRVSVTGLSRTRDGLDITDPTSVEANMGRLDGPFDLIIIATGILAPAGKTPEKSLAAIEADTMAKMFAANATGPALLLRHAPRLLDPASPSVVAALTARVGSIADNKTGGWYAYRASKAAANQIVRGAAIEIARKRKHACVVALHPGTVDTPFTAAYAGHAKQPAADAAQNLLRIIDGLRTDQTGRFFDWAGHSVPW